MTSTATNPNRPRRSESDPRPPTPAELRRRKRVVHSIAVATRAALAQFEAELARSLIVTRSKLDDMLAWAEGRAELPDYADAYAKACEVEDWATTRALYPVATELEGAVYDAVLIAGRGGHTTSAPALISECLDNMMISGRHHDAICGAAKKALQAHREAFKVVAIKAGGAR